MRVQHVRIDRTLRLRTLGAQASFRLAQGARLESDPQLRADPVRGMLARHVRPKRDAECEEAKPREQPDLQAEAQTSPFIVVRGNAFVVFEAVRP